MVVELIENQTFTRPIRMMGNKRNVHFESRDMLSERNVERKTASNGRFGASGGVARPTSSANLQVSCPAQTAVSRHLTPSRWDVGRNAAKYR